MTGSASDSAVHRFPAVMGSRQRIVTGVLGIGLGFGGPFVLSVAMMASSGDPALVILPLPFLGALWLMQGLAPAAYVLDERGVSIDRRILPRVIPYAAIEGVDRVARPIGGLGALGINGLFGSRGPRWNPRTGRHYLAITNTTDLVYLHTRRGLVVISPARPDEFVRQLSGHLAPAARRAMHPPPDPEAPADPGGGSDAARAGPGPGSRAGRSRRGEDDREVPS